MFGWFIFGLFDLISAPPLSLNQIGYAIVLLCLVCFVGSLYFGIRVWNSHATLAKAEYCLFVCFFGLAGWQDSSRCEDTSTDRDCRKAITLGFCIWTSLLGSRWQQTSTDLQSKNSLGWTAILESNWCFNYYPSSYRSLEASLSTSASRSTANPIVFSLDRNKPVTLTKCPTDQLLSMIWMTPQIQAFC